MTWFILITLQLYQVLSITILWKIHKSAKFIFVCILILGMRKKINLTIYVGRKECLIGVGVTKTVGSPMAEIAVIEDFNYSEPRSCYYEKPDYIMHTHHKPLLPYCRSIFFPLELSFSTYIGLALQTSLLYFAFSYFVFFHVQTRLHAIFINSSNIDWIVIFYQTIYIFVMWNIITKLALKSISNNWDR